MAEQTAGSISVSVQPRARAIHAALGELISACRERETRDRPQLERALDFRRASAANLSHYLALRQVDHRPLQKDLIGLGLSSLGRLEPAVLHTLTMVRHAAGRLLDPPIAGAEPEPVDLRIDEGRALLDRETDALLGPRPDGRAVRIMVTAPAEAAGDGGAFVRDGFHRGMDALRINTTQDDADAWRRMVGHVRTVEGEAGRRPLVFADLGGPKIRVARLLRKGAERDEIRVRVGDELVLHRGGPDEGEAAETGRELWCDKPEALREIGVGHGVWFDDGKIGTEVESVDGDAARLRVTFAKPKGQRLRLSKGINLPDTPMDLPALSAHDLETIDALADEVDAFCLSFVTRPEDVHAFIDRLRARTDRDLGVVLKIETRRGFERLPELLFALMRAPKAGVMIARGDLAVEVGFERLAEVQEEILWLCEAAHTPVIWATEVLSSLAKRGAPSRAEVTDAAMAQRAECVMLNKGPEILRAVEMLGGILARMESHQRKKMASLRPLAIARG